MTGRLCVDIDNCVTATDAVMRDTIRRVTDGRVNLRYEDIREFDYHGPLCCDREGNRIDSDTWKRVHDEFSKPEVVLELEPIPGAIEGLRSLQGAFDIHYVTTRLPKARAATIEWLDRHGLNDGPPPSIHFVGHRQKHTVVSQLSASIEDDPEQARLFAESGVRSIVLAHPWNQDVAKPAIRVESWAEISGVLSIPPWYSQDISEKF